MYIRHGCISIRDCLKLVLNAESTGQTIWLNELIWREFYQMILYHSPQVVDQPFNTKYDTFIYPGSTHLFDAWKTGQTGFPIIDAAMRCLNQTGWMHNRLRMVTASFYASSCW